MSETPLKVLMVCLGNICRSPTAEAVFRGLVQQANLTKQIEIDSAGTGSWHIGHSPDSRAAAAALNRGYDLSSIVGRQVLSADYETFDYILAMDKENLSNLLSDCPTQHQDKITLLLSHGESEELEVPDPYYSGQEGFELVLDLVEDACEIFLQSLTEQHQLH